MFPSCQRLPGLGPVHHNGLWTLILNGHSSQIIDFFSIVCLPSLFKLTILFVDDGEKMCWRDFHQLLVPGCPRLGDYTVTHVNCPRIPWFDSISPLFSLPLQKFDLRTSHSLELEDIHKITSAWPSLNVLSIAQTLLYAVSYEALKLLSLLSQHLEKPSFLTGGGKDQYGQ